MTTLSSPRPSYSVSMTRANNLITSKLSALNTARKLALLTICLALATAAHASTVLTLDSNFSAPDYAFFSYTDTSGGVHSNIPIDPYIATITGGGYNNSAILAFCYDYNSETFVGTAYSGTVEPITAFSGAAYTATMEATYLINLLNEDGLINAPLATRGNISMAIWQIMNPSSNTSLSPFPTDAAALPYEADAANAVSTGSWTVQDAARYPTWVPDNPGVQRYGIMLQGQSPVPEPGTLVLSGLGLIALSVISRKMRTRTASPVAADLSVSSSSSR
jgi:hypothetical protein